MKLIKLLTFLMLIPVFNGYSQSNWIFEPANGWLKTTSSLVLTDNINRTYTLFDSNPGIYLGGFMPVINMIGEGGNTSYFNFYGIPNSNFSINNAQGLIFQYENGTYDRNLGYIMNGTESNTMLTLAPDGKSVKIGMDGGPSTSLKVFGNVGIGTNTPRAFFDIGNTSINTLKCVLARLPEGDAPDFPGNSGEGTYLGVKSYNTQPESGQTCCGNIKSFAIEHKFYGHANSSVNFYRGDGYTGGYIGFNTNDNSEKMRIDPMGNIGIGVNNPQAKLQIGDLGGDDKRLLIPGAYNFERVNLTMGINGNGELEFVTHSDGEKSGGIKMYNADGAHLYFQTASPTSSYNTLNYQTKMVLTNEGYLGIGTTSPDYPLDVVGIIRAHRIKVNTHRTADFVFASGYKLPALKEVENYISTHKHLEGIPSAPEMEKDGIEVSDMAITLLQKVEELTLYSIQLKKENEVQKNMLENQTKISSNLQQQVLEMKKEMEEIRRMMKK